MPPILLHPPRWDQLLEAVSADLAAEQEGGEEGGGSGGAAGGTAPDAAVLLNQFRSLVMERYIERVPPCTLPPPANVVRWAGVFLFVVFLFVPVCADCLF